MYICMHSILPSLLPLIAVLADPRVVLLEHFETPDAIGWVPSGPLHHRSLCINPAPFGRQCTMHEKDAIISCLGLAGCNALTCPAPAPYITPSADNKRRGIKAAICQARRVESAEAWQRGANLERRHGMCKPGGCRSFVLRDLDQSTAADLPATPAGSAALLLLDAKATAAAAALRLGPPLTQAPLSLSAVSRAPLHAYAVSAALAATATATTTQRIVAPKPRVRPSSAAAAGWSGQSSLSRLFGRRRRT